MDILLLVPASGIVALLFASYYAFSVLREEEGTEKMVEIARAIQEGATAFIKREYKTVSIFAILIAIVLAILLPHGHIISAGFLSGVFCSALAGFIGMYITVRANVRTANKAREGLAEALKVAFRGGAVTGFSIVGLGLLGLGLFYIWLRDPTLIVGYAFGASLMSLFARVGGGIYTKAADVGADLVGKVEAGIPEDDPRNPAVIADNVGDAVGDCAGMGADLFETYVVTAIAAMLLGASPEVHARFGENAVILPLFIGAAAIVATIFGSFFVRLGKDGKIMRALYKGIIATTLISAVLFYAIIHYLMEGNVGIYISSLVGLGVMAAMIVITEYYTTSAFKPVKEIAKASKTGAGTNVITGLAFGHQSAFMPAVVICAGILISYFASGGASSPALGIFGISVAAAAMLSTTGIIVSVDSYGPITDNAGGIAEMADLPEEVRGVTDPLDAVGNTTKAVTKGYAIGSAALAALSLYAGYKQEVLLTMEKLGIWRDFTLTIEDPIVLVGVLLGAAIPYLFVSYLMLAVGRSAFEVVEEVRRQFREIPGIMEGKAKPQYGRCVDIVTKAALRELMLPAAIGVLSPILVGLILGPRALGGLLFGVIVSGLLVALMMTTGGAAWDNAKKLIEEGFLGGKGSEAHKAAVVGDVVGDAYKDTAGPAINPLIKVMNTVAILFVYLIVTHALMW
ncbi:MAG: sodium-translocating pyrophosphatase [Archaeoglobi archaeon]|nr:sodium-translocating pyrophosphatase [Candidatus Mnemosynella bozhongmuii]